MNNRYPSKDRNRQKFPVFLIKFIGAFDNDQLISLAVKFNSWGGQLIAAESLCDFINNSNVILAFVIDRNVACSDVAIAYPSQLLIVITLVSL